MNGRKREWIESFRSQQPLYELFGEKLQALLTTLLETEGMATHSTTYRVKDLHTLAEKLTRPGKEYAQLDDVNDLLGVRIVTQFADDVDRVVALIDREFEVDAERSEDKRPNDPDRFGYASVHRVCRLPARLAELPECHPFADLHFEIQIRSILQHAWAEIEHDLGYKVAGGIPHNLRRRFSMLAGLLELADDQFMRLRDELTQYSAQVTAEVQRHPETVAIDPVSLESFIQSDPLVRTLDEEISNMRGRPLMGPTKAVIEARVAELQHLGLATIKELAQALEESQGLIRALADQVYRTDSRRGLPMSRGGSLSLLVQVLIGRSQSLAKIHHLLDQFAIASVADRPHRAKLIQELVHGHQRPE